MCSSHATRLCNYHQSLRTLSANNNKHPQHTERRMSSLDRTLLIMILLRSPKCILTGMEFLQHAAASPNCSGTLVDAVSIANKIQ
jgi:hypothetical protein